MNFGVDGIQTCCNILPCKPHITGIAVGITPEYRRFALGSVRTDHQYFFTYSLANIGSFGNLVRKDRLY